MLAHNNQIKSEILPQKKPKPGSIKFKLNKLVVKDYLRKLKMELAVVQDKEYAELNRKALTVVTKKEATIDYDKEITIRGYTGVPGSGKTTTVTKTLNPKTWKVISPYKRLLEDYKEKNWNGSTFIAGILTDYKQIVLDEVFVFSPGLFIFYLYTAEEVFVIGDPYQMEFVDDYNLYGNAKVKDILPYKELPVLNHSYTVPLDVTRYLNSTYYRDRPFTTSSTVVNSVKFITTTSFNAPSGICFSRRYSIDHKCNTVAMSQGMRRKEVNLIIDTGAPALIRGAHGQLVVAISRHSEKLNIYTFASYLKSLVDIEPIPNVAHNCVTGGEFVDYTVLQKARHVNYISRLNEKSTAGFRNKVPFKFTDVEIVENRDEFEVTRTDRKAERLSHAINKPMPRVKTVAEWMTDRHDVYKKKLKVYIPEEFRQQLSLNEIPYYNLSVPELNPGTFESYPQDSYTDFLPEPNDVTTYELEEMLAVIAPSTSTIRPSLYGFTHAGLEAPATKLWYSESGMKPNIGTEFHTVGYKLPFSMRGRPCTAMNPSAMLHCMLRRYSSKTERPYDDNPEQMGDLLFKNFIEMLEPNHPVVDQDLLNLCLAEQLNCIKEKNNLRQVELWDAALKETSSKISCFLKTQTKKDLAPDSWLKPHKGDVKAGQGVSAQPKTVNLMVGSYVRAVEKCVRAALPNNILFGFGYHPNVIANIVKYIDLMGTQGCEMDISEFDSQRGAWTDHFMTKVYEYFGVEYKRVAWMAELNKEWILDAGNMKSKVVGGFQSGRQDTLLSNTLVALAFALTFLKIEDLKLLLAQGDDILIYADKVELKMPVEFLKLEFTDVPTFCGYLVVDTLVIDPVAMCVKLGNRIFKDDQTIDEYINAVADWLQTINNLDKYNMMVFAAAKKYSISSVAVHMFYSYLKLFSQRKIITSIKSENLVSIDASTLQLHYGGITEA